MRARVCRVRGVLVTEAALVVVVVERGAKARALLWGNCCASLSHSDGVAGNPRWPAASRLIYPPSSPFPSDHALPTAAAPTAAVGTLNSHRSNSRPARPRPIVRSSLDARTAPTPPPTATGLTRLFTVAAAAAAADYVTREDICRQRKLSAFIFFFFSDAATARRGVYHNNVECMRNELIPRHRLIKTTRVPINIFYFTCPLSFVTHKLHVLNVSEIVVSSVCFFVTVKTKIRVHTIFYICVVVVRNVNAVVNNIFAILNKGKRIADNIIFV